MTRFQAGAQLYSVRDQMQDLDSMRGALRQLKAMGYNTVQLSGHSDAISDADVAEAVFSNGLTVAATHVSFDLMQQDIEGVIAKHKLWQCAYAGIGGMPGRYHGSAEGFERFAREANEVAKKLSDAGLTFIYHNHAFELQKFDGRVGLDILIENAAPEFQFEIDTFWIQSGGGSPAEWIRKVKGRMDVVHFKEMVGGARTPSVMVPFGEGNLPWRDIFAACEEAGVKFALIEQDNATETDSLACMKTSVENLRKWGVTL